MCDQPVLLLQGVSALAREAGRDLPQEDDFAGETRSQEGARGQGRRPLHYLLYLRGRRGLNQLRWDPTLREWVAYATHRQDRTFLPPAEYCPLCPTKPGGFPTEVPREHYDIVVFENRFPSFAPNAPEPDEGGSDLTPTAPCRGICEVVLYSDDHDATLATMSERRIGNLIEVWADRFRELGAREEVDYVFIFENKGEAIGVTLHHPHGQIYGYPFIHRVPRKSWRRPETTLRKTKAAACTATSSPRSTRTPAGYWPKASTSRPSSRSTPISPTRRTYILGAARSPSRTSKVRNAATWHPYSSGCSLATIPFSASRSLT